MHGHGPPVHDRIIGPRCGTNPACAGLTCMQIAFWSRLVVALIAVLAVLWLAAVIGCAILFYVTLD